MMSFKRSLLISPLLSTLLSACSLTAPADTLREPASASLEPKSLGAIRVARMQKYRNRDFKIPFLAISADRKSIELGRDDYRLDEKNEVLRLKTDALAIRDLMATLPDSHPLQGKGKTKAINEIVALTNFVLGKNLQMEDRNVFDAIGHIQEISDALRSNLEPPIDGDIHLAVLPLRGLQLTATLAAKKTDNASNVDPKTGHPYNSSLWELPKIKISNYNFYNGFGRTALPDYTDTTCTYQEDERGYGTHPRFTALCDGNEIKVKFGSGTEVGPLNARLYDALGFHGPVVDYTTSIKVAYDRNLLLDFSKRLYNEIRIKFLFLDLATINASNGGTDPHTGLTREQLFNPFLYIRHAETHDGKIIKGDQLKQFLLKDQSEFSNENASNYITSNEAKIKTLVFSKASVFLKDKNSNTIGNWDYDKFDHPERRELRGLHVLSAWTGNFDHRRNNTRLQFVKNKENDQLVLRHQISDVDSGIGKATIPFAPGIINQFPWQVSSRHRRTNPTGGHHGSTLGPEEILMTGIGRIERISPFEEMSEEDGRWMLRLIAQIKESQITQALIASGYSAAEVVLLQEKLISRRNSLFKSFQLERELAHVIRATNEKISYDGKKPISANLPDGTVIKARVTSQTVVNGVLQ